MQLSLMKMRLHWSRGPSAQGPVSFQEHHVKTQSHGEEAPRDVEAETKGCGYKPRHGDPRPPPGQERTERTAFQPLGEPGSVHALILNVWPPDWGENNFHFC